MKRWHLTFGLATVALGAAWLAPRLLTPTVAEAVPPPPPEPDVRVSEIVTVPVEAPVEPQGRLIVDAGLDQTAIMSDRTTERYLTITVTAPEGQGQAARRQVDLGVVMDTSGSMAAQGKIDQARRAAKVLAEQMSAGDTYSLTVFNDMATVVIPAAPVTDPRAISLAVDRIYEGGGTNLFAGIERGAAEVKRSLHPGATPRVVILSDGIANIGVVDDETLVRYAADLAGDGIAVSAIGLGLEFNEDLLARLADVGGGSYHFVDNASELQSVFSSELDRMATVIAHSTNLEVRLPDGVTPIEVIGWDARPVSHPSAGTGWDVYLGDMYAGETKKIVARVRIEGAESGQEVQVAAATATYLDVIDQADGRSWDEATVVLTDDPSVIAGSVDRSRSIEATRAVGSKLLDMSTRAWAEEDFEASARLAEQGTRLLRERAQALGDDTLRQDAESLDATRDSFRMHTPSSIEGRTLIKSNKERFRDLAR
jgi:Ca-activated chloride channel homolog